MKNKEQKTIDNIEKLSKSLDIKVNKRKVVPTFKTKEVVILLLLTTVISLAMGGIVTYNVVLKGEKVDDELQEFITNYDYIVDNYYGDVDKTELVDSAIAGMLSTLDKNSAYVGGTDTNFSIYLEGTYEGTGIQVYNDDNGNIVVYSVFGGSPASKAGLKEDDIIIKVNDKDTTNMSIDEFSKLVKDQNGKFNITYKRGDSEKTVQLKVDTIEIQSVSSKVINKDNKKIGYIRTTIFANNTYEQFKKELDKLEDEGIDGLVIDLRGNSGGHLSSAEQIISLFLDSSHPIYQIKSKESKNIYYSTGKETKNYKISILIDGNSASASEVVTSALAEQYGAKTVGKKSYGKGTVQELQTLSDGDQYKLTTKSWLTSKGEVIDGKGIEPDYDVTLSDEYLENPTDENDDQLQKAIEVILE
ncbi:c-terminal processing peptidase [Firmicutes bacterium CAG:822]|nr:c-terminal processing peptidase [Firmicutes bacterium CAG:822]